MTITNLKKYFLTLVGGFIKVTFANGQPNEYFELSKSLITRNYLGQLVLTRTVGTGAVLLTQSYIDGDNCTPIVRTDTFNNMYEDLVAYFAASGGSATTNIILTDILTALGNLATESTESKILEFLTITNSYTTPEVKVITAGNNETFNAGTIRLLNLSNSGEMSLIIGSNTSTLTDIAYMPIKADGNGFISEDIRITATTGYIIYTVLR